MIDSDDSVADFGRKGSGRIEETQRNVLLALCKLGVSITYDEFARHELISGLDGFGPRLDDAAINRLRMAIESTFAFRVGKEFFRDLLSDQAQLNRFHPVRNYLGALVWDHTPRIDTWLIDLAGAKDTAYVRAVSRLMLVAAARRVRRPGAKFDEMPIIEGDQGCEKSSALAAIAVREEWFTDDLPLGTDTKKLIEATAGKWIVEAGELKGMNKSDVAALKSCLSRRIDESRMSYDHKNTVRQRQFIVIGTTNETDGYLKDPTGNRRFWPVRVERFDLERLRADRDQLWAEAANAEAAGESIRLAPELWTDAAIEQEARRVKDPMFHALDAALGTITGKVRIVDVWSLLGHEPGKPTQDQMTRLGNVMRELGFEHAQRRFSGSKPVGAYVRGTEAERDVELFVEVDQFDNVRIVGRAE